MKEGNKNIISKLVAKIRALALSGLAETETYMYGSTSDKYMHDGDVTVYYQPVRQFLPVYIEAYGSSNSYCYRLYRCSGAAVYNRKIVLDPELENDDFRCVFNYEENSDHEGELCSIESGNWIREFEETIEENCL